MTRQIIYADSLIAKLEHLYEENGWKSTEVHFSLSDMVANIELEPKVAAEELNNHNHEMDRRIVLRNAAEERRLIADILDAISYSDIKDVGYCLDCAKDIVDDCNI